MPKNNRKLKHHEKEKVWICKWCAHSLATHEDGISCNGEVFPDEKGWEQVRRIDAPFADNG